MKKLLSLLGALGLAASAGSAVIACGNTSNNETQALSKIVKHNDLGEISTGNAQGIDLLKIILDKVNLKNDSNITVEDVYASADSRSENGIENTITIKAKSISEKFTGEVKISYTIKTTADAIVEGQVVVLKDISVAKDKEKLTAEDLIKKVRNEVKFLKESKFDNKITVEKGNDGVNWNSDTKMGTATLKVNGWDGSIKVAYFVKGQHAKIEKLIPQNKNLGTITIENGGHVTPLQVKEALKATLPDAFAFINLNEITVNNIDKDKKEAKIKVQNFEEEATVKFDLHTEKNLNDVIKTTNLGQIVIEATNADVTPAQVKEALKKANKDMSGVKDEDITVEEITNTGASIKIKDYSKHMEVTFTVKQSVASVITTKTILVDDKTKVNTVDLAKDEIYKANQKTLDAAEIAKDKLTVEYNKEKATATVKINNPKFEDKGVEVKFENKKAVNEVITTKTVYVEDVAKLDNDAAKAAILEANKTNVEANQVNDVQVTVEYNKEKATATVKIKDNTNINAATEATVKFENKKALGTLIKTTNVEVTDATKTTKEEVLAAVVKANKLDEKTAAKLALVLGEAGKATITTSDEAYTTAPVNITYTTTQTEADKVVTTKVIYVVDVTKVTKETAKNDIIEANKTNLTAKEITAENVSVEFKDGIATVTITSRFVKEGTKVTVEFKNKEALSELIKNKAVEVTNATKEEVLAAVVKANKLDEKTAAKLTLVLGEAGKASLTIDDDAYTTAAVTITYTTATQQK